VKKITFLTGAGASYGCKNIEPYNPPLGRELFSDLENEFPEITSEIQSAIQIDDKFNFEKIMYDVWESDKINLFRLNAFLANYFSKFKPKTGNTYFDLFKSLLKQKIEVVYSTLNYDCIPELAAEQAGYTIHYSFTDNPSANLEVLKLHGSCNFLYTGVTGNPSGFSTGKREMITINKNTKMSGPFSIIHPNDVPLKMQDHPASACMSYYMKDKPTIVGNSAIKLIQELWQGHIATSDLLIIIGVNVNLEDKHIWHPISITDTTVGFVGSKSAFSNLQLLHRKSEYISDNFSNSVSKIIDFIN